MRWNSKIRFSAILAGTIVACMHVSSIEAEPPDPVFWTWQDPPEQSSASSHPSIIAIVRHNAVWNPANVANAVAQEISDRSLQSDEICILLKAFGKGHGDPEDGPTYSAAPLYRHWCDSLIHEEQLLEECELTGQMSVDEWWMTLWMSNGVTESGDWMQQFIDQYKLLQTPIGGPPDPIRFHFDSEGFVLPTSYQTGSIEAFDLARTDDSRWGTELLYGHNQTLKKLFDASGVSGYNTSENWLHDDNKDWTKWYMGIAMTTHDAAMYEAAYSKIRAAWPGVAKSSNYRSSNRVDGLGNPARLITDRHGQGATWYQYAYEGSADLQAPVFYPAHIAHFNNPPFDQTHEQASVRVARGNIESMINSFGGGHEAEITPWIGVVGHRFSQKVVNDECQPNNKYHDATKDSTRRLLTMLHGKDIREFGAWCSEGDCRAPTVSDWNDFADVIDQVWGAELLSFSIDIGQLQGGDIDSLRYSHSDFLEVDTPALGFNNPKIVITVEAKVAFDPATINLLRLNVENVVTNAVSDVDLTVSLYNTMTSQFDEVGMMETLNPGTRTHVEIEVAGADVFIDDVSGLVKMQLEYTSTTVFGFRAQVDIVQLIEADD